MGVVKEVGKVLCPESGQNVILWDVTDKVPTKFCKTEFEQRLHDLGFETLEDYYKGDHWVAFREAYWTRHPRVCVVTGPCNLCDLHHITYDNLGAETDADVVPLRHDVHELVHKLVKEYKVPLGVAHLVLQEAKKV